MCDQIDTSGVGASGQPNLVLIYAMGPIYWRLLAASISQLRIDYDAKEDIGEFRCQAHNAFGENVTSQMTDELTQDVVDFGLMLVEHRYPNWSLRAGAYGRIDWNLTRNDLVHKHHRRTVMVATTEHRGI